MKRNLRPTEAEARVLIARLTRAALDTPLCLVPITKLPTWPTGSRKVEPSRIEAMLALQMKVLKLPEWVEQYVGAVPGRKYRLDFAWPEQKIAVECQGMVHRIKGRFKADTGKMSLLVVHGWRVLPVSGDDVRSGRAAAWITTLLGAA